MKINCIIAIASLTVIYTVNAIPQNNDARFKRQNEDVDPEKQIVIDDIFRPRTTTPSSRGANVIVTPDPNYNPSNISPTTSPQTFFRNEQNCTCVPYHMCDPNTNTIKNEASDDEVTGFGVIDIRFNEEDCQDVLDVCCIGAATREEPIQPKKKENVPTKEAGCGVRNVGGIDFELKGAMVFIYFI